MTLLVGRRSRFIVKTLLPTLLTIGLFITSLFFVLIPRFEEMIYGRKREMIRELTLNAWSILDQWHRHEQDGSLTREQAQRSAIAQIEGLRYGDDNKDYFWITDGTPTMIVHPYRPDLNGRGLADFTDSRGKRLFVEMARTVERAGEGYVDYTWQWKDDSTRVVPKLSFVKGFAPWQWVIGTGIYLEDVKAEIAGLERQTVDIAAGISVIIAALLFFIAFQNLKAENRRQRAEQELHESREKYRTLVETSTEGLIMILADHEVFCNRTLYAMLGYPEESAGGVRIRDLFLTIPRAETFDFDTFSPAGGREARTEQVETKLRKHGGGVLDVLISISPISLLGREGMVLSVKDISLHKKMEDALDSSQEQYRTLTNQLSIGVFRTAPTNEGAFLDVNPAAGSIMGAGNVEELLSTTLRELFDDPRDGKRFFDDLLAEGIVRNRVTALRRLNGSKAIVSLSAILSRDKQDRPVACDGIVEDITEQQQSSAEREGLLSDLQASLVLLNQSIRPFVESYPSCPMHTTVGAAIQIMTRRQRDAVLVTTDDASEIGIVTERDIRERVLTRELPLDTPLHAVMTAPLISLPASVSVFDLLQVFVERKISHAVVERADGRPLGIVHARDLQQAFHASYLYFLRRIESLSTERELREYYGRLQFLVRTIIERGSNVADVTRMTTMISHALTRRIITLACADLGEAPAPFAFITLGSDGRKEQTLVTDQDNAIVFADPPPEGLARAHEYFLALGVRICAGLDAVGYHYCKGGVMARNPKWCQPLSVWKNYFSGWVATAQPQDILDAKIFFDLRLTYGSEALFSSLQAHVKGVLTGNDPFFLYLAESVLKWEMPEQAQKLKSPFDIKKVLMPLVDGVRLYALKHHVPATNTLERLDQIYEANVLSRRLYLDIVELYSFLMRTRFRHQAAMLAEHRVSNNDVDPAACSEIELLVLKKAVAQIGAFRDRISLDFRGVGLR
jgi:PAS domain S-box-containing protein